MSCGAVLFAAGTDGWRFAAPNSTILIHDVSSQVAGKVGVIKIEAAEAERLNTLLFSVFDRAAHRPAGYFTKLLKSKGNIDWYLTPEEAKKLGLVNTVKLPKINISVVVKQTLE